MSRTIALAVVMTTALAGCGRFGTAGDEDAPDDDAEQTRSDLDGSEAGNGSSEEEKLSRKLDLYTACLDRSRPRLRASWGRYVDDIDPETGLPRRKTGQPFVYAIDKELDPCHEAQDRGKKLKPPLPAIESAMDAYLEASTRFAELTRELAVYYESEAYAADEWAKGKALAPDVAAAWKSWHDASERLASAVSNERDEVEGEILALIEAREGKSLQWHARNLAVAAKGFRRCVEHPEFAPKTCQADFDTLKDAHQAFRANHDGDPVAARKVFWMLAYQTTADEYLEQATTLMQAFAKSKPKTRTDAIDTLLRIHDDLASDHANLKFDFP